MNIVKLTNPGTKVVWKTSVLAGCNGNVRFMHVLWDLGHVLRDSSIVDQ